MKQVTIVRKDGKVTTDFSGFEGEECFDVAEELRKRLKKRGIEEKVEFVESKEDIETEETENVIEAEN